MSAMEELMQAALTAPDERKTAALRVLRGEKEPAAEAALMAPERFVTLKECGRLLGVSACSLWRWNVPGHDLGGRRRFRVSEVVEYLESAAFKRRAEELKLSRKEVDCRQKAEMLKC